MKRVAFAVLFEFAARAAGALLLAAPITAAVAASGIGNFPAGDRLLFERGGLLLVEVARASWALFAPLAGSSVVTGALLWIALTLPAAVLWTALADETRDAVPAFLGRACARVPALFALGALGLLAQTLALTLGFSAAELLHARSSHDEMHADLGALAALAVAGAFAALFGIVRDVAGAALACGAADGKSALRAGLRVAARAPGALLGRWLAPTALGLLLVVAVAFVASALDVGRPEGSRLVLVALAHQLAVLGLTLCRAAWFRGAVRVARPQLAGGSDARR